MSVYKKEANRLAADFLEFNAAIDRLLGLEPSLDRWPYSAFKPTAVERWMARRNQGQP